MDPNIDIEPGRQREGSQAHDQLASASRTSRVIQRSADALMLLIESEKAKACAAVTEELASRNREYEEFRAKAAETLTAALARVSTVQKEAQITIAQIQAQADSLAEELCKTRELLDARNEEVQGWKTRFAELEMKREEDVQNSSNLLQVSANKVLTLHQELDQANSTKNSEMESLRNHISWLETQLQNPKSGSSHTVEGDPDVTMIDSAGLSSTSTEPKDHSRTGAET